MGLLALVHSPGRAHATDLTSEAGFLFDIQDGVFSDDGSLSNGSIDAYDGCYRLEVNGETYTGATGSVLGLGGRQVETPETAVGGLVARRFIYVPETGPSWARYLDVISNPGGVPVTATIGIVGNLGSDGSTSIFASSSGDASASTDDLWFSTDDDDGSSDPSLAHVVQGDAPLVAPTVLALEGFDDIRYEWSVTVPAGGRVAVLTFAVQDMSQAVVQAEARRLAELPDDALVGIDVYLPEVINFQAGTPCAGAEGAACTTRGRTGTCHAARCCTGCFDGTRCLTGTTGTACGVNGGACAGCGDGDLCTSDVCTAGVCSNPTAPSGTACDDRAFCTTGDVCNATGRCAGSGPPPCDDGRSCTVDTCDETLDRCENRMGAGCVIGGECVGGGTAHPVYPCLVCDPARNVSDWSPVTVGTVCRAGSCAGGRLRPPGTCDAAGLCASPTVMTCASGRCADATSCEATCATAGCPAGEYCSMAGDCRALVALGAVCSSAEACVSGHCVDGVCCDTACDGVCAACNLGATRGTCSPRPSGTDPEGECAGAGCDGAGACVLPVDAGVGTVDAGMVSSDGGAGPVDAGADASMDAGVVRSDAGGTPVRTSSCAVAHDRGAAPVWLGIALACAAWARRRAAQRTRRAAASRAA